MGGTFPLMHHSTGKLFTCVPALYRIQSGTCWHGRHPEEYRWSSYRANAPGEKCEILSPHSIYLLLGKTNDERQTAYRELFRLHLEPGIIDNIRKATNGNFALGNDRFQDEIALSLGRRVKRGAPGRPEKQKD